MAKREKRRVYEPERLERAPVARQGRVELRRRRRHAKDDRSALARALAAIGVRAAPGKQAEAGEAPRKVPKPEPQTGPLAEELLAHDPERLADQARHVHLRQ